MMRPERPGAGYLKSLQINSYLWITSSGYKNVLNLVSLNLKQIIGKMEGIKYLTDEKGNRIAVQIELKKHKRFIEEYLEFIEDRKDVLKTKGEETVPFEEVISKFETLHGGSL